MLDGFTGLMAMSSSLSPLLSGPSFETFTTFDTRAAWAAETPTISAKAAARTTRVLSFTNPPLSSLLGRLGD